MKVNNPNRMQSLRNLESVFNDRKNSIMRDNMWSVLEKHNKKYKDDIKILYDEETFIPKIIYE